MKQEQVNKSVKLLIETFHLKHSSNNCCYICFQSVLLVASSIVAISLGVIMGWWFKSKKEKMALLQNPDVKYTVPLIAKEVSC